MPLFATDFGAGSVIGCCAGVMFLAVMVLSLLGIHYGDLLRHRESNRGAGTALIVVCTLLPFLAYFGPSLYVRATLGRWPLDRHSRDLIQEGMTREEVHARLGEPNRRRVLPGWELWYYHTDSVGANVFGVHFGADGRVTHTYVP